MSKIVLWLHGLSEGLTTCAVPSKTASLASVSQHCSVTLGSTPSHFSRSVWRSFIVCFSTECKLNVVNAKTVTPLYGSILLKLRLIISPRPGLHLGRLGT